jgi:hypothetical protein
MMSFSPLTFNLFAPPQTPPPEWAGLAFLNYEDHFKNEDINRILPSEDCPIKLLISELRQKNLFSYCHIFP